MRAKEGINAPLESRFESWVLPGSRIWDHHLGLCTASNANAFRKSSTIGIAVRRKPTVQVQKKRRIIARVQCRNIKNECPKPTCDEPVLLPGRCCKSCPGDYSTFSDGST
ncbi:dorsal-ventral patterning protein Sog isoform X1 [Vespula maculifrons]|uniref:Dorsal-ventral patterning protein Sog isoform X1 n=1 Tax=Vespula maculifrons TaxID=7453 RepID=A0ABD2BP36_VESMC